MFFNPLFIDTNSTGQVQGQMNSKLGKSQYLFSDIIKISLAQSESAESESTPLFNLSLVKDGGSISSLFHSSNSTVTKTAQNDETSAQNPEAMLIEFLQYAFLNQSKQGITPVNLKELMKDKELLLSKDSLTNALSQLLQMYQPAVDKDTSVVSANTASTANSAAPAQNVTGPVSPENLASQILASLDDKGKVVLNFKNTLSQIKIELTKLNNQEKELFISTKIIPMSVSGAVNKTENAKKQSVKTETDANNTNEVKSVQERSGTPIQIPQINSEPVIASVNQETAPSITPLNANSQTPAAAAPASKNTQSGQSGNGGEKSNDKTGELITTGKNNIKPQVEQVNNAADVQKPELAAKTGTTELSSDAAQNNDINITTVNNTKLQPDSIPVIPAQPKSTVQAPAANESEIKNNDYKLRVVEITTDKNEKVQDAKIFPMTQFEKNLLKKSTITYTSNDTAENKPSAGAANKTEVTKVPEIADENINTVSQADEKILKTNNLLFDQGANAKQPAKDAAAQVQSAKIDTEKKDLSPELMKSAADSKGEKIEANKTAKTEIKQGSSEEVKTVKNFKEIITDKNIKNANPDPLQVKENGDKTLKQAVTIDDNKLKNADSKSSPVEQTADTDKKTISDVEKASLKQNTESEQKEANNTSNQNNGEKKGSENRLATLQNVSEKEKVIFSKEEILKDPGKLVDVSKTVKTYELIKEIKTFIEQGSKSTMTLNIEPENLGSVKISLDVQKNMVQARIDVNSENVKQYVQNNLDSLKQSLNQSGVNLGMIQVNVSSSDQKQQKQVSPFKKRMGNPGSQASFNDSDAEANQKILGYNSYDYLV